MNSIIKRTALTIAITGLFCGIATAQHQSQAPEKSDVTVDLSYYKKADMTKTAVAIIKTKNKAGKFVFAKNARINFYALHDKEQLLLKSVNTDIKGQAVIVLQKDLPLDKDHSFTIAAKIENDNLYANAEGHIHYKEANLTLNLNPHDTDRIATAHVTEIGNDGKEIPVKGAKVNFYVQRLFGNMPAAEDNSTTTDEKGEASFTFPKGIPGGTTGDINVVARMEDNEQFGNVENRAATAWGTAIAIEKDPFQRALWEPYAPLPLVLIVSALFGGVWCIYIFLFLQLGKIKKEGQL